MGAPLARPQCSMEHPRCQASAAPERGIIGPRGEPKGMSSDEKPSQHQQPAPGPSIPAPDPHPVTDRYVARRLAEGAATRAAESREETENLVGEPPAQGAFLFYLLLGLLISILLLVVIFRTSEPAGPPDAPAPGLTSLR
jgi:hypothetical protein